jgi:hypothetical protein
MMVVVVVVVVVMVMVVVMVGLGMALITRMGVAAVRTGGMERMVQR